MGAAALALVANLGHTASAGNGASATFDRTAQASALPATASPAAETTAPEPSPTPTDATTPVVDATTPPANATTPPEGATTTPVPVPSLTPTPLATTAPARKGGKPTATPTPTPTPIPTPTPTETPSATPTPTNTPVPSPSATPLPEIRPFVAGHRTVPESMNDPRVTNMASGPISELVLFDWLKGTWRSHTLAQLPTGGSRDLGLNTYVFAPVLDGRWIFGASGHSDDEFYITYDVFARRYVALRIQGDPSYGLWVSYDGWRGDKIVFVSNDSTVFGRPYVRRMTIEHPSARAFNIIDEEQRPDGTWSTDDVLEMNKQAS